MSVWMFSLRYRFKTGGYQYCRSACYFPVPVRLYGGHLLYDQRQCGQRFNDSLFLHSVHLANGHVHKNCYEHCALVGSFVSGLVCKLNPLDLFINLLPLIILAIIVVTALILFPKICIKCFKVFGIFMRTLAIMGLVCAMFTFVTGIEINPHFDTLENAAFVCVNACVTLSGTLPLMFIVSKLLNKPLNKMGSKIGVDGVSALAFLGNLVTNASTFGVMEKMNKKGVVLNSAFAVSAAFVFGGHLAFTMAFDSSYVIPVIVGKLVSGVCAVILALLIYKGDVPNREE